MKPKNMDQKHKLAVKSFIVKDNKLLLLQRNKDNTHKPGEWDIPGGRLEDREDPSIGLRRETKEETGLQIEIVMPIGVQHFVRDDGEMITMIIFLCTPVLGDDVTLSDEHINYEWVDLNSEVEAFPSWLNHIVDNVNKYNLQRGL
jgi:8-oxo-dGTP diphosphatase